LGSPRVPDDGIAVRVKLAAEAIVFTERDGHSAGKIAIHAKF
jgi:hypothetical protein